MLDRILRAITRSVLRTLVPHRAPLDAPAQERALAALLVRLARADDHYQEVEQGHIEQVLMLRQGLSHEEARALRLEAEAVEAHAPDTVRFTRSLKAQIPYEDRAGVVAALWRVALSDGARGAEEEALIRMVAPLLGVSDRDSALARQRVARDLGL